MCNRRKPIQHISGNMGYRFSDAPVLLDGGEAVADGRIWITYIGERDEQGWDVDWNYDNFDEIYLYGPDGEPIATIPDGVYDQIKAYLDLQPSIITDAVYDHTPDSF